MSTVVIEVHHTDGESAHGALSEVEISSEEWNALETESERVEAICDAMDAGYRYPGEWGGFIAYRIEDA